MASLLEESYRQNAWNVNIPRAPLKPIGYESCPIPENDYDLVYSTDATPTVEKATLQPFMETSSVELEDREITIDVERGRGVTVDDGYLLLDNYKESDKVLYPQTLKQQNLRIDEICHLRASLVTITFNPKTPRILLKQEGL